MERQPQKTKETQCKTNKSCALLNGHEGNCQEKRVYFYQRPDGKIILMEDTEASLVHGKYKQVGVGSGDKYREVIKEGRLGNQEYDTKISRIEDQIERLEEKQLDAEIDSKKYKLYEKKIIALIGQRDKLNREKQEKFGNLVNKAKQAEFKEAKGNLQSPPKRQGTVVGDSTGEVQRMINAMINK